MASRSQGQVQAYAQVQARGRIAPSSAGIHPTHNNLSGAKAKQKSGTGRIPSIPTTMKERGALREELFDTPPSLRRELDYEYEYEYDGLDMERELRLTRGQGQGGRGMEPEMETIVGKHRFAPARTPS